MWTHVRSGKIHEYVHKKNGLRVVLAPRPGPGITTMNTTFLVGSRMESAGKTGNTHALEHLLFKGSAHFNPEHHNGMWQLEREGAVLNATTYCDRTNYYEVIDTNKLHLCIEREADRMVAPLLKEDSLASELTVVRNEYEQGENSAFMKARKSLWGLAYPEHPYGTSTIGTLTDIEHFTAEKLRQFHRTYYAPNNAIVSFCGQFDPQAILAKVDEHYGDIPSKEVPTLHVQSKPQTGQRRAVIQMNSSPIIGVGFKSCKGLSRDAIALQVLGRILTSGPTSKFFPHIQNGVFHSVQLDWERLHDESLFTVWGMLSSDNLKQAEETIFETMKHCKITNKDLEIAKKQLRNEWTHAEASTQGFSQELAESAARGDLWDVETRHDVLQNLTLHDMEHARNYFDVNRSNVITVRPGHVNPLPKVTENITPAGDADPNFIPVGYDGMNIDFDKVIKTKNGAYFEYPVSDVHLCVHIDSDASPELNSLMGELLTRGTRVNNRIVDSTEIHCFQVQNDIRRTVESSHGGLQFNIVLPSDPAVLDQELALLKSELYNPVFPVKDFETTRRRMAQTAAGDAYDVNAVAETVLRQQVFGHEDYRYPRHASDASSQIWDTTLQGLRDTHAALTKGRVRVTAVANDMKLLNKIQTAMEYDGNTPPRRMQRAKPKSHVDMHMEGMSSNCVMLGCPVDIDQKHPDFIPLMLGVSALGGGFAGRLMLQTRDREGLTYGIYAGLEPYEGVSLFKIRAAFNPTLMSKGIASMKRVTNEWAQGITQDELDVHKRMHIGKHMSSLDSEHTIADLVHQHHMNGTLATLGSTDDRIRAVTLEDVNHAMKTYINVDNCTLVRVGTLH